MNPLAIATVLTSVWHFIPEERREKYINRLLDVVEDLGVEAVEMLRKKRDPEQMEMDFDNEEHY